MKKKHPARLFNTSVLPRISYKKEAGTETPNVNVDTVPREAAHGEGAGLCMLSRTESMRLTHDPFNGAQGVQDLTVSQAGCLAKHACDP